MNYQIKYSIENIKASKKELSIQIFLVFVLPITLMHLGVIELKDRVWVLAIIVGILILVLEKEKWTNAMLGLNFYRIKKFLIPYTIFTLSAIVFINVFGHKMGYEELSKWWKYDHFIYGFFIVSALQEVGYRAYLIPALGKITSKPVLVVLINAIFFTYLHTIFPNPIVVLPMAFVGGLGFAIMYMKYPSLPLIIISHSIINFFAVLYGFFVIPGVTY